MPPRFAPFGALRCALVVTTLAPLAVGCSDEKQPPTPADPNDLAALRQVLDTNAELAFALYADAVDTALQLRTAVDRLITEPSTPNLAAARRAWLVAREPYGQSEVFRFRASPIDDTNYDPTDGEDGPEGAINAWPLGEALIDYVVRGDDFGLDQVGVSAHETGVPDPIPDNSIVSSLDVALEPSLLERSATAEDERDVISGYHAIEFLLWGQDLNGDGSADTRGRRDATPGQRPATDYARGAACTSGPRAAAPILCERRGRLLQLVTEKLVADLTSVRDAWAPGSSYRRAFTEAPTLAIGKRRLLEVLTGMGTLSEGELAGERMQIALSAGSQEDEHSCFSDNTHRDIWLDAEGVSNVFRGRYAGYDGDLDGATDVRARAVDGFGVDDYLRAVGLGDLAGQIEAALARTETHYRSIDASARGGAPFDVLIMTSPSAPAARPIRETILALNAQASLLGRVAEQLGLGSASDVVDPDASECNTGDPEAEC